MQDVAKFDGVAGARGEEYMLGMVEVVTCCQKINKYIEELLKSFLKTFSLFNQKYCMGYFIYVFKNSK